jgi:hypothetical protein
VARRSAVLPACGIEPASVLDRPAQSARRVLARAAKQRQPAWQVVDDFPADIAVLPGELRVIETYLAALLDESFEQMELETDKAASETAKCDVE